MTPEKAGSESITEYINAAPKEAQKKLVKCARVFAQLHPGPGKA